MGKRQGSKVAVGTLIAAGIGYAVGVLTAPKSGKATRKDLQRKALHAKAEAEKKLKELHSELDQLVTKAKKMTSQAGSKAKSEINEALDKAQKAKEKVRLLLSAIHEGDSDDRELKQAIVDVNKAIANLKKYVGKSTNAKPKK